MDKINGQRVSAILLMTNKNKEKTQLTVNVSVEPFSEAGKEVRITSKDILHHLTDEKGMAVGKCIQSSVVSNMSENSLFGTWLFELPTTEETIAQAIAEEIAVEEDERILKTLSIEMENSSQDDSKPKRGRKRIVKKEE